MNEFGGHLFDSHGKPIPPGEVREEAVGRLQDFIIKNKDLFEEHFKRNGPVRPPIKYHLSSKTWLWVGKD